jgi:DNA-binding NtrC family response regulator
MSVIAVIDDHIAVRNSVEIVLKAYGHAPILFSDSLAFCKNADIKSFDVFIVDNDMPLLTGIQFFQKIQNNLSSNQKFILMSGNIITNDFLNSKNQHEIIFLSKPFSLLNLLKLL